MLLLVDSIPALLFLYAFCQAKGGLIKLKKCKSVRLLSKEIISFNIEPFKISGKVGVLDCLNFLKLFSEVVKKKKMPNFCDAGC